MRMDASPLAVIKYTPVSVVRCYDTTRTDTTRTGHNLDRHNPDRHNPDRDVTWTGHNPDRT